MIFAYNKAHVGDTLMVIVSNDNGTENTVIRKWNVAQIKDETGQIVGWNFSISPTILRSKVTDKSN